MIRLVVNGDKRELAEGAVLDDLLRALALTPGRIAVELNEAIVPRERYGATPLREGDRVEIVQFVGGG